MTTIDLLTKQLEKSKAECTRLQKENELLKQKLAAYGKRPKIRQTIEKSEKPTQHLSTSISIHSPVENKIELFRNFFRGRDDVYPVLWQARDGRKGYSPACKNEWQSDIAAFHETCRTYRIPAVIERSRSGNGGHVWIFFQDSVGTPAIFSVVQVAIMVPEAGSECRCRAICPQLGTDC